MSKVYVARKCFNCGAILQNESPEKEGYTSKKDYNSSPLNEKLFCDECQNEADYVANTSKVNDDLLLMMKDAAASDALIVYIINLFSFESSFIPEINQIINRNNILVIANKIDLFTNNSDDEHLKEYVAHRFRIALLSLKSSDVLLTSIASFGNIDKLKEEILKRRKGHDVYVISSRGAGKRMFFSSFLCNFKNNSNRSIKTKACKGAIIPVLQIPLDNSSTIYDTPYLPSSNSIDNKLEKEISESLLFSSKIKMKKMNLKANEAIAIGGLAFIELLSSKANNEELHIFLSPSVTTKKINLAKNIDKTITMYLSNKTIYPKSLVVRELKDLDVYEIDVSESGDRSIGIEGLGWVSFLGHKQQFRIYVPKGIAVYTGRSKVLTYGIKSKK